MAEGLEFEDEDIVLENSPLYQHLRETGFLETDTFQFDSSKEKFSKVPLVENYLPFFCCLKNCFKELLFHPLNIFSNLYQQVKSSYLERERKCQKEVEKKLLSCILNNDVLIEDDKAFLKNFSHDDELTSGSDDVCSISTLRFYWFLALFFIFLSYIWKRLHSTVGEKQQLFRCGLELFLVIIFLVTVAVTLKEILNKYCSWKALEDGKRRINKLISSTNQTNELLKKCILIVQEAELIARGFTLASVTIPASRLETSKALPLTRPQRQCPELRKSVFHWAKSLFQSFKMATLELQKLYPFIVGLKSINYCY
ncbi:vezatin-like [Tachypleus tridentatus]|uniref:vezatin-like n=1 Tax=Tachypleus tridentatus TaxID=6853 RepID=UPI003FD5DB51